MRILKILILLLLPFFAFSQGIGKQPLWTLESAPGVNYCPVTYQYNDSTFLQAYVPCDSTLFSFPCVYSPDSVTLSSSVNVRFVEYENERFITINQGFVNDSIFISTDGRTFNSYSTGLPSNLQIRDLAGDNIKTLIAVSTSGTNRVARSTDNGISWSEISVPANTWSGVEYTGISFIAVSTSGTNRVIRSTDNGISWSEISVPARAWEKVSLAANGRLVAVSSDGYSMYSDDDGLTWTEVEINAAQDFFDVSSGNGLVIAVGSNGAYKSIDNGASWSEYISGVSFLYSASYGDGYFILSGDSNTFVTTGYDNPSDIGALKRYATYGNGVFVSLGSSGNLCLSFCSQINSSLYALTDNFTNLQKDLENYSGANYVAKDGNGINITNLNAIIMRSDTFATYQLQFTGIGTGNAAGFRWVNVADPNDWFGTFFNANGTEVRGAPTNGVDISTNSGTVSSFEDDGTRQDQYYGQGNKTASDLSKTSSAYFRESATDGTLLDRDYSEAFASCQITPNTADTTRTGGTSNYKSISFSGIVFEHNDGYSISQDTFINLPSPGVYRIVTEFDAYDLAGSAIGQMNVRYQFVNNSSNGPNSIDASYGASSTSAQNFTYNTIVAFNSGGQVRIETSSESQAIIINKRVTINKIRP